MIVFQDYEGRDVILSDSAEAHILDGHYEIRELGLLYEVIGETLASPDLVVNRNLALHYYRMYYDTPINDKFAHVVVVRYEGGWDVRTAFPTDKIQAGVVIWEREI